MPAHDISVLYGKLYRLRNSNFVTVGLTTQYGNLAVSINAFWQMQHSFPLFKSLLILRFTIPASPLFMLKKRQRLTNVKIVTVKIRWKQILLIFVCALSESIFAFNIQSLLVATARTFED